MAQRAKQLSCTLAGQTIHFFVPSCLSPTAVLFGYFSRSLTDRAGDSSRAITTTAFFCLCHEFTLQKIFSETSTGLSLLLAKTGVRIVYLLKYFIDFHVARHVSFVIKAGRLWFTLQCTGYDLRNTCHPLLRQTRWMYPHGPSDKESE